MTQKMRGLLLFLAITMLLVAACSKDEKVEDPVPELEEDIIEDEPVEEVSVELFPSPFTGIMKEEENTRRPVLATINNHPLARPQSGISDADIIYEQIGRASCRERV